MLKQLPPILFIIATFLVNQVTLHSFKRYVGCYSDGSPNDLSALGLSSDPSLTQEKCWQKCRELQYLYAGLQGGNECWCGNQYGRYGRLADAACSVACTGDSSQVCGGGLKNQVYMVQPRPCIGDWKHNQEAVACYKALNKATDWMTGSQRCSELGGTLVDITNNREQYFLDIMLFHNYEDHWVGARYGALNNTRQFFWHTANSALNFENWMKLEPAVDMTAEGYCVYMGKNLYSRGSFLNSFQWAAANCTLKKHVVCESRAVQCDRLVPVGNAISNSDSLAVGSVIHYSCITGHEFPDASRIKNITCYMDGTTPRWSESLQPCSPVECPNNTDVDNAIPSTTQREYGTVVTYRCLDGFKFPNGGFSTDAECLSNKTWSVTPPACERVNCSTVPVIDFSSTVGNGTLFGDTHCFTCDTGYMFPGYTVNKCVMCDVNARWNDTLSPCQPLECPEFQMENIEIDSTDFTFTSVVSVKCGRGYKFPDNITIQTVECTSEAVWNETVSECLPIQCVPFPPGVLTVSNETGTGFGTTVLVYCPEGEEFLDGNTSMIVRCESFGYWTPSLLSCAPKLNIKAMKLLPPEEAPEAVAVATPAIVLLVLFVCTIIILDLTTIQRDLARLKKNLKYVFKRGQEEKRLKERRERFRKIYGFYHPYL